MSPCICRQQLDTGLRTHVNHTNRIGSNILDRQLFFWKWSDRSGRGGSQCAVWSSLTCRCYSEWWVPKWARQMRCNSKTRKNRVAVECRMGKGYRIWVTADRDIGKMVYVYCTGHCGTAVKHLTSRVATYCKWYGHLIRLVTIERRQSSSV